MKSDDLRRALRAILSPAELEMPGWVNYSGLDVLKSQMGGIYLIGLNPATDDSNVKLGEYVPEQSASWSAYTDTCWMNHHGSECEHIELSPMQMQVLTLAKELGIPINNMFATNAVFIESNGAPELAALGRDALWEKCWPIHQRFLAEMQPRKIICLGYGDGSSYSLLKSKSHEWAEIERPGGSRWKAAHSKFRLFCGEFLSVRIVGLPHPSWSNTNGKLADSFRAYELAVERVMTQQ